MAYFTSKDFDSYDLYKIYYGITQQMGASGLATEATLREVRNALIYNYGLPGQATVAELIQAYYQNLDSPLSGLLTVLNNISTYTAGTQTALTTSNPNLIRATQDISGNSDVYFNSTSLTNVDTTVYTVTGGKTLYLTDLQIDGVISVAGNVFIRDGAGGKIIATIKSTGNIVFNFSKPVKITTSVYYDYSSGTITAINITGSGYEK